MTIVSSSPFKNPEYAYVSSGSANDSNTSLLAAVTVNVAGFIVNLPFTCVIS